MDYVSGYSYPHTGSLAYPLRTRFRIVWNQELLALVLEFIHPGNLGVLPPNPALLAYKAEQMGLAKFREFLVERWY